MMMIIGAGCQSLVCSVGLTALTQCIRPPLMMRAARNGETHLAVGGNAELSELQY